MQTVRPLLARALTAAARAAILGLLFTTALYAEQSVSARLTLRNHRFEPAEIHIPANQPIALTIRNLDGADIEFESVRLRVEKVIPAGGQGTINLRPLQPGRYNFLDDFHSETRGTLVVP